MTNPSPDMDSNSTDNLINQSWVMPAESCFREKIRKGKRQGLEGKSGAGFFLPVAVRQTD